MTKKRSDIYGITSLTLGIVGITFIPFIAPTLAVIFGSIGLAKKQRLSLAGLIIGVVGMLTSIFVFAFWLSTFLGIVFS